MFFNYLKTAIRHIARNKYSFIVNILGFSAGLACSFLLLLWVFHEFSYDRFHNDYNRIHRIGMQYDFFGDEIIGGRTMDVLGPELYKTIPEIESFVTTSGRARFMNVNDSKLELIINDIPVIYAGSSFFDIFSFPLLEGDPKTALKNPFSIVITKDIAQMFFPDTDPIGRELHLNGVTYLITGITENPPKYTHFDFSIIASFETLYRQESYKSWNNINSMLYVKLKNNTNHEDFIHKVNAVIELNVNPMLLEMISRIFLQPIHTIHTDSVVEGGFKENLNRQQLIILLMVSLLLLVVAGINYVVNTIARSTMRLKEIGIRKILGADRLRLIVQFLSESVLTAFFASLAALLFMELLLPLFNNVFGATITLFDARYKTLLLLFPLLVILIGLLTGIYPAFYLSKMIPARIIHERMISETKSMSIKNILTVLQIFIAISFIICAFIMRNQFYFIETKEPGFSTENRIVIPFKGNITLCNIFKERINNTPGVILAASSDKAPGAQFSSNPVEIYNYPETPGIHRHVIDHNYLELMQINIMKGRNFDPNLKTDVNKVLVNKRFIEHFNLNDPLKERISSPFPFGEFKNFQIIGVVEDYHFASLHSSIEPLIIYLETLPGNYLTIWTEEKNQKKTIERLKLEWSSFSPQNPFLYYHIDEAYYGFYENERNTRKIINFFTSFVIIISVLGLYGLVHLDTISRTKGIGIKKVLGASVNNIILKFLRQYFVYLAIASIIAIPVTYILMERWLQTFAYRVNINNPINFLVPLVMLFCIILITIISHIIRVAKTDPVKVIRYE